MSHIAGFRCSVCGKTFEEGCRGHIGEKPRIRLDPTRPGWRKWECVSTRVPAYGGVHVVEGKGYSPIEAYLKWRLSRR